ncbi:MAG TPA: hypothetical protein VJ732_03265 [Bryobacteraceae bacterium]|nr:hypothetical protein [Bryobacteraceae bacterium]
MRTDITIAALSMILCAAAQAQNATIAGRLPDQAAGKKARPAPRLPDGHPDLGNAAGSWNPRIIADIAGASRDPARSPVDYKVDVPFQPWAKQVFEQRMANLQIDDPEARCLPPGVPRMMATPFPFQIYQLPDRIIFLFEGGAHVWRIVYMDGRAHPKDPNPTFLGDSVGHWEGDTLVVDAVGFNDETWLDQDGHPHTGALHVIERYTRTDETTLHYQATIDDPKAYTQPWTIGYTIPWSPKSELLEYICQENNKDLSHLVGK